jgi:uncharacterized protein YbjT (DUF2867 family)
MQHLEPIWHTVLDTGVHAMPFGVERRFSVVDLLDIAEAVARVVTREADHYATYELAGPEPLSQRDMADVISRVTGRRVTAEAVSLRAMESAVRAKGLSDDRIEQMRIMNDHYDRHGFPGNSNVLGWLLGRPPTTFETYVRRLADESV